MFAKKSASCRECYKLSPRIRAFIVGMPRSGTTLLSATLGKHSEIFCGPETHFFNKFRYKNRAFALIDPFWPRYASKQLSKITLSGQNVASLFGTSEQEIFLTLKGLRRSHVSLFDALQKRLFTESKKEILLEKTPNHLIHVKEIRQCLPSPKFIRIVRDPRGSAVSMRKLPWASTNVSENAKLIAEWYNSSAAFFSKKHQDHITLKYESFSSNPEESIKDICSFLGISYEASILHQNPATQLVTTPNEIWKEHIHGKIDRSLGDAWRNSITTKELEEVNIICQSMLSDFGYD